MCVCVCPLNLLNGAVLCLNYESLFGRLVGKMDSRLVKHTDTSGRRSAALRALAPALIRGGRR